MKKFFSVALATVATILLTLVILFTVLGVVINNETFINNQFTELGIGQKMGMSNVDLVRSYMRLVNYMEGEVPDIALEVTVNGEKVDMFAMEQEIVHMEDVRTIYQTIASYRDVAVLATLVLYLFAAIINFRMAPQRLAQGYLSGTFVLLLLFGFLGAWAAMDFSGFWTFFHQMLFWNELWLFDATESRMINMLPEEVFASIIGQIALYVSIILAVLIAVSVFALIAGSDGYRRRIAAARAHQKQRKVALAARKKAKAEAKAEQEKQKRIAKRKAQRAAEKRRVAALEETERAKAAQREKRRAKPSAAKRSVKPASSGAQGKRKTDAAMPARKAAAPKRRKGNIADDTGFFDDDDI